MKRHSKRNENENRNLIKINLSFIEKNTHTLDTIMQTNVEMLTFLNTFLYIS